MKMLLPIAWVVAGMLLTSCASHRPAPVAMPTNSDAAIVTPSNALGGKVVAFNEAGRFVVLNFAASQMPRRDQTLFLYRAGLKVAEIKITGPQNDDNTVADIVTGEAQMGDEVREQ